MVDQLHPSHAAEFALLEGNDPRRTPIGIATGRLNRSITLSTIDEISGGLAENVRIATPFGIDSSTKPRFSMRYGARRQRDRHEGHFGIPVFGVSPVNIRGIARKKGRRKPVRIAAEPLVRTPCWQ
jgi:hypothetical protein